MDKVNALEAIREQLREAERHREEVLSVTPAPGEGGVFTGEKKEPYSSVRKKEAARKLQKELERKRRKAVGRKKKHYQTRRRDERRKWRARSDRALAARMATPELQFKHYSTRYADRGWEITLEEWLTILNREDPDGVPLWRRMYTLRKYDSDSKYTSSSIYIQDSITKEVLYCSKEELLVSMGYCIH